MKTYPIDELDYVMITRLYDRYPQQRVTIYAPDGVAIMGCVPHEERGDEVVRVLKPGVVRHVSTND